MKHRLPILLLPGIGADARLFAAQLATFPTARVVSWITPRPWESLPEYAARLAPEIDPGEPCLLAGASFGGMVALEMATHLPSASCVMIGSARSPAGYPWRWHFPRFLTRVGPDGLQHLARLGRVVGAPFLSRQLLQQLEGLARPESGFTRWALCAAGRWRPSPATRGVRVFQIHGSADPLFPAELAEDAAIVPDGVHALTLFQPAAVNRFLENAVRQTVRKAA